MRVLFLTHRLPYAPNRGDRIRAYHMLHAMSAYAEVDLVSLTHDADETQQAGEVPFAASVRTARIPRLNNVARGFASLHTSRPLTHTLLNAPGLRAVLDEVVGAHAPDVVLAYCSSMAKFALEPPLADFPFVLDMVDVDSAKWAGLAQVSGWPLSYVYRREAWCLSQFERRAMAAAKTTLVVNDRERSDLVNGVGGADIQVVPNGVDIASFARPASMTSELAVVFSGVMDYGPNEQAAIWLATHVWPEVRRRQPRARLLLVGSNPTQRLRRAVATDPLIELTGTVSDVRPYLWRSAVAAAPLQVSRGIQNKVLEAVAAGLPCVITPVVRAGLPEEIIPACSVAETPLAFAERLLRLLALSQEERKSLVQAADLAALRWESRLAPLHKILATACGAPGNQVA